MRRPSPALVVAFLALVAACAGSATAASLITGAQIRDGSLTGADVRNRSLGGRDLRSNTVTGRNVERLSGRDVIRNGLDGSDIDENTLEAVPQATRARTADTAASAETAEALAKARVVRVAYAERPGSGQAVVYDEGGLRVTADCSAAGRLTARAVPTAAGGIIRVTVTHPGSPAETTLLTDNDFSGGDSVDLVAGGASNTAGRVVHYGPVGDSTTIEYLAHESATCLLTGNAVHTVP